MYLSFEQIEIPRNMMRKTISQSSIKSLAKSMAQKEVGLLNPVLVRRIKDGYELVAGVRRMLAAELLGWETIPAKLIRTSAKMAEVIKVVENKEREAVAPLDEGLFFAEVIQESGWTQKELAEKFGYSEPYISNRIRALEWHSLLKEAVINNKINFSVAIELAGVKDEGDMLELLNIATRTGTTPALARKWRMKANKGAAEETEETGKSKKMVYEKPSGTNECKVCGREHPWNDSRVLQVCPSCNDIIKTGMREGIFASGE